MGEKILALGRWLGFDGRLYLASPAGWFLLMVSFLVGWGTAFLTFYRGTRVRASQPLPYKPLPNSLEPSISQERKAKGPSKPEP